MAAPPDAALAHADEITRLQLVAVRAGRQAWSHVDGRFISESWTVAARDLRPVVTNLQERAAAAGAMYGAAALAEQGAWSAPQAFVDPSSLAGYAPDGRSLDGLLYSPAATSKRAIGGGVVEREALRQGRDALGRILRTVVSDAGRQGASVDIAVRPRSGYVRALVGSSCPACVILAGKFYRWNAGFKRHPGDDCIHVPTTRPLSQDVTTDPYEHFNAMSEAEQDAFWGPGDAQAIRDGADIYRVGNARRRSRGMTTLEGTARRPRTNRIGEVSGGGRTVGRGFASDIRGGRLTPDGIYATATSREQALTLLREHGYILPGGQVPGGSILGNAYEGYGALGRGGTRVGARQAVERARRTGDQATGGRYAMTEAQRRLADSEQAWIAVLEGRNPYGRGPLTPDLSAQAERTYRRWLTSGGEVFTR